MREALNTLYSVSGTVLLLFYIPQLIAVIRAKGKLEGVSILTWGTWGICFFVWFLYGAINLGDFQMALFSLGNSIFCLLIAALTLGKRYIKN